MAEAFDSSACHCSTNPSSSTSVCTFCEPSTSVSGPSSENPKSEGAISRSEGSSRRTFRSLSLGSRKQPKPKEKSEKTGKSKLNWTLRWRMKSPQLSETREPMIDLARFNPADYPIEDKDEVARRERAREIAEGIEMEIESLPPSYRLQNGEEVKVEACTKPSIEAAAPEGTVSAVQPEDPAIVQPNSNVSIIDGLTVLLHRSLAISFDSQMAWNVLNHVDLHFLVQHFHWHQHHHGPQVI